MIPQIDGGTRYLCSCPRGEIGVDVAHDGSVDLVRCLGASATTARDLREARRLVAQAIDDELDDDQAVQW